MRLQDLNWMDVERYLEKDDRIIFITGSTEQHAHLSLLTDTLIPQHIADAVAEKEKVLVAPPMNFGVSHHFMEYPGTITLSAKTFEYVVLEAFESLCRHGFSRFLIINGHGGNVMPGRFADFGEGSPLRVIWHDWWKADAAKAFAQKHTLPNAHANWSENFPFNRVAESPKEPKAMVDKSLFSEDPITRSTLGDGSFGGPYQVDDKLMNELFNVAVDEAVTLLQSMGKKS